MSASGWIGVDLDGTLAKYNGWNNGEIGEPVPLMVKRVKGWIAEGVIVKIFTARVSIEEDRDLVVEKIQDWTQKHIGERLEVTNQKDYSMVELWDDRAIQVIPNKGLRVDGLR
jgi:hypothetical protein